jgi:A/G-specific adenine glycosylase
MKQQERIAATSAALVDWWHRHKRDLPWRRRTDPYAIWVSEIMLQQTRVATVVPFYERFLHRFPDVHALAGASRDDVLKTWEGMGYYSRARNLHQAAQQVVAQHDGELPSDVPELRKLPGIGRYTSGAIASIAFSLDEPVLDGNVTRVLCRVFRIAQDPKRGDIQRKLWSLARRLIPRGKAGLFNQAMMDLGATVCVPRKPLCLQCPLRDVCSALAHGQQEQLPLKKPRPPLPHQTIVVGVVWRGKRLLIDQRPEEGLLGGLWEFPGGKVEEGETLEDALLREIREELGIRVRVLGPLATVQHAYTHFRITLHAFECRHVSGRARAIECSDWKWVELERLGEFAFPRANGRLIELLQRRGTPPV